MAAIEGWRGRARRPRRRTGARPTTARRPAHRSPRPRGPVGRACSPWRKRPRNGRRGRGSGRATPRPARARPAPPWRRGDQRRGRCAGSRNRLRAPRSRPGAAGPRQPEGDSPRPQRGHPPFVAQQERDDVGRHVQVSRHDVSGGGAVGCLPKTVPQPFRELLAPGVEASRIVQQIGTAVPLAGGGQGGMQLATLLQPRHLATDPARSCRPEALSMTSDCAPTD
jgi:hypothetical protein